MMTLRPAWLKERLPISPLVDLVRYSPTKFPNGAPVKVMEGARRQTRLKKGVSEAETSEGDTLMSPKTNSLHVTPGESIALLDAIGAFLDLDNDDEMIIESQKLLEPLEKRLLAFWSNKDPRAGHPRPRNAQEAAMLPKWIKVD